ncbi:hypothetical protein QTL97_02945 [Sporosarcina thermotolerans]|uniref:Short-chain dehydrogenase n=1 Tax=Sporosarcina thermotolerans TaxID=633404 RepID=A0AAW9A4Y1_9BACL|nr:hypothetical protein [Sporosarcina thermotolerans]MDW0115899.1 hypothetical protein [Sporosarcina thermotolerans]WHT46882.1 hypothetical protein QNH10_10920 [Sporosarcina thermotolerans]
MVIWVIPLAIVFFIIGAIGWKAVRSWNTGVVLNENDHDVSDAIEDHPMSLNPIIWVIAVATLFILFVIFFYWASSI